MGSSRWVGGCHDCIVSLGPSECLVNLIPRLPCANQCTTSRSSRIGPFSSMQESNELLRVVCTSSLTKHQPTRSIGGIDAIICGETPRLQGCGHSGPRPPGMVRGRLGSSPAPLPPPASMHSSAAAVDNDASGALSRKACRFGDGDGDGDDGQDASGAAPVPQPGPAKQLVEVGAVRVRAAVAPAAAL